MSYLKFLCFLTFQQQRWKAGYMIPEDGKRHACIYGGMYSWKGEDF